MSLIPFGFWAASGAGGGAGAFDLLETTTLTTSASSVTFSGLGAYSDYKHLQIRQVARSAATGSQTVNNNLQLNGSSSTYGRHYLIGNGSSVSSSGTGSSSDVDYAKIPTADETSGNFGACIIDILDFSNTSKNTTIRSLAGATATDTNRRIGIWSGAWINTSSVTSIELRSPSGNFVIGSRFSLIGIK